MTPPSLPTNDSAARDAAVQSFATERDAEHPATLAIRAELDRTRALQLEARRTGDMPLLVFAARARVKALRAAGLLEVT